MRGFLCLGLASIALAQPFSSDETHDLIQALGLYERLIAKSPDLWPEFDPRRIPVAIYRSRAQAIIVGHPSAPPGRSMPTGGRSARVITTPKDWFGAGPVAVGEILCGRVDPAIVGEGSSGVLLGELVREAFRTYQRGASPNSPIGRQPLLEDVFSYPDNDAQNDAALEIESILLERTLADDDGAARLARAKELCELRRDRRARLKPATIDFEEAVEVAEGAPTYVAVRAIRSAVQMGLISSDQASSAIAHLLGHGRPVAVVGRLGMVSARTALLLDTLTPNWRDAFHQGRPLQSLVEPAVGTCSGAAAARQRLGFSTLFVEAQRRVREEWKRRELSWGQLDAAGGIGVVSIELGPFVDVGAQEVEYTSVERIDANRRVHGRLRVSLAQAGDLLFDQAVAEDRSQKRYVARLPQDAKVIVDGEELRLDLTDDRPFLEAIIIGKGLELTIHGGLLHVLNGGLRLRPFPRGAKAGGSSRIRLRPSEWTGLEISEDFGHARDTFFTVRDKKRL